MVEADTGANITVFKAESLQEMAWVELEQTEMQIQGYSGIAENCVGKAKVTLQLGSRAHDEEIYFSNITTSNCLSRDASIMFKIIPKGFPHAEVNVLKASDKTPKSEERVEITPKSDKKDENMSEKILEDDKNILKLVEEFSEIFKDKKLEPMNTEPMEIKLRENYVPKALTVPRKVPYARRDDEIKEI